MTDEKLSLGRFLLTMKERFSAITHTETISFITRSVRLPVINLVAYSANGQLSWWKVHRLGEKNPKSRASFSLPNF